MRHYKKGRKLGTDYSHTKAMKRSLVSSLFLNDRIKTIESRAKEIRGDVDKIIKWAKKGDLHSRRLAISALNNDKYLVAEIFEKVAQGMFKERNSGYTRIVKLGTRKGDNAHMVLIELINEGKKKDKAKDKKKDKKEGSKTKETPKNKENNESKKENKDIKEDKEKVKKDLKEIKKEAKPKEKKEEEKSNVKKDGSPKIEESKKDKAESKKEEEPKTKKEESSKKEANKEDKENVKKEKSESKDK